MDLFDSLNAVPRGTSTSPPGASSSSIASPNRLPSPINTSIASTLPGPSSSTAPTLPPSTRRTPPPRTTTTAPTPPSPSPPLDPHEDPELVGTHAAARARDSRLYRESCLRGEEALKAEDRGWDFLLGQMNDWEARQRSWGQYRRSLEERRRGPRLLRMIGRVR